MKQLVISVHGIRTFGNWQGRLETLLKNRAKDRELEIISYKFGFFSVIAFLFPPLRWLVVRRFRHELVGRCIDQTWDRVDLVGHSFGTHIIAWALHGIPAVKRPPVHTILLAGSVLKNYFPWQTLIDHPVKRLINDCGTKDTVLIFSQFFVLFTGMAGRLGFNGGTGEKFRNRYFAFGHSGYFLTDRQLDDRFMEKYWVPLLVSDDPPILVDERTSNALSGIWLTLLNNAEPIKVAVYVALVIVPALKVYNLYLRAEASRQEAQANFEATDGLLSGFIELVSENVQPSAQLKVAQALVSSTNEIVSKLPVKSRDDPRIRLQRARAYIMMAELKYEAGDISGIRDFAQSARDILQPLEPNAEKTPEALHLMARSSGLVGLSHTIGSRPDPKRALTLYKEALAQLEELGKNVESAGLTEANRHWLASLARLQRGMGDLLLRDEFKQVDEAEAYYAASVKTFRTLRQAWPDWTSIDYELAWTAENKYGDILWRKGDARALDQFQRAASRIGQVVKAQLSQNLEWEHSLAIVEDNVGSALRDQGRYQDALAAFEEAKKEISKLHDSDPARSTWAATFAWTYDSIGETKVRWARRQRDDGLLKGADEALDRALKVRERLVQDAPDSVRYRIDLAVTKANIRAYEATVKEFKNDFAGAAGELERAAELNSVMKIGDERNEEMALRTIEFRQWAALDFRQAGNVAAANAQLSEAMKITREQVGTAVNHKAFEDKLIELVKLSNDRH